jgi:hypothetical protein
VAAYIILKIAAPGSWAHLFALTMEHLFSPCTRLRDRLESQGRGGRPAILQELNLDVSTEELLSAERAFTYADLYAILGNEYAVAWLTPHAAVVSAGGRVVHSWMQLHDSFRYCFHVDGQHIEALASSPEHLLGICDVVLRLLAASAVHSVILHKRGSLDGVLINTTSLAYLMEHCQSLKTLTLAQLVLDENHCRVLGVYSRPGLEIELKHCKLTSAVTSALAEVLGRNQGPTKLYFCEIDNSILANGLRENSRLKSLTPSISTDRDVGNQEVLAIAGALKENKGLVYLDLEHYFRMSDETWDAVCDSLKTHPTLQILDLRCTQHSRWTPLTPAVLKSRIQTLLEMMKVNMSIHTIRFHHQFSEHELFRGSVIPYLETNRLRPRVRAIQKTRPIAYRVKVLGRALLAVRTDVNSFWMLLSGNAEIAFPSTTATTTPAANLPTPTPAPAAATSNTAVTATATAAVTVTVTVTASRAASTTGTATAANVATPTACHKRKARP